MLKYPRVPISLGRVELFCLFVAFSYTSMEATMLSCHFIWVWSCMPKVLWNNKSSISLERVYDFAEFIHVVTCILLDSHYSYRNMLFWVCTIRHRLWLSDFLNLKNSKTIWVTKLIFGYHWSYEKYHAVLVYGPLKFLVN